MNITERLQKASLAWKETQDCYLAVIFAYDWFPKNTNDSICGALRAAKEVLQSQTCCAKIYTRFQKEFGSVECQLQSCCGFKVKDTILLIEQERKLYDKTQK